MVHFVALRSRRSGQKMLTKETRQSVRFGPYEADFEEGVLRKFGLPVKLQGKPLAVLSVLVENAGKIVSREDLSRSLWPDNTRCALRSRRRRSVHRNHPSQGLQVSRRGRTRSSGRDGRSRSAGRNSHSSFHPKEKALEANRLTGSCHFCCSDGWYRLLLCS